MKQVYFLLALCLICFQVNSQIIYGVNNYTQYMPGTLPIVISIPHGGLVAPADIPNRTCNNPTTVWDNYTIELGRQIDTALFNLTGCHPHLIICNLRRTKVDCNRNIADGACGNIQAETAWTEFSNFIDTAQAIVQNQFSGKAFYIDLHAHGHVIKDLELGYGISGNNLTNTDSVLNTPAYIASSSIGDLVTTNVNGYTHAQLLRGVNALGTLFANAGFSAVPSQQSPDPNGNPYFSGGYNTINHTCISPDNTVNGLQIETPSTVWNSYSNRKKFADSTATILTQYMWIHQNLNLLTNCGINSTRIKNPYDTSISFEIFPNPATDFVQLNADQFRDNYEVIIINVFGEIVFQTKNQNQLSVASFAKGFYVVKVTDELKNTCTRNLIIH